MEELKKKIVSFEDLEVYQCSYQAMMDVMTKIVPRLPDSEKFDLTDQLRRACKAIPRLIAEGYAKRHQKLGFQKYLDDAMGECNEMVVSLKQSKDIYPSYIDVKSCEALVVIYDKTGRQLYRLRESWNNFKK
jgi:four helix bundle protein